MKNRLPVASFLEMEPNRLRLPLGRCLKLVSRDQRKSYALQIAEMARLRFGRGKINRKEYYYFRLYDDREYNAEEKHAFAGRRLERQLRALTGDWRWYSAAHDKLLSGNYLKSLGFPVAKTHALYRRSAAFPALPTFATAEALGTYLREANIYPFFSKPTAEIRSIGAASVDAYDRAADELIFANGRRIAVGEFVAALEQFADDGYIFQERLEPHPDIARICGNRLATVRLFVLVDDDGPGSFRALWRIPASGNSADNFSRKGNVLAAIDPESGRAWRVIMGVGPERVEIDAHPETGATIKGMTVPLWPEMRQLCLSAAPAFPRLRMQAWDVAATSRGPVLIEVNMGGDYPGPQLATGKGMLEPRFRRFIAYCAERRRLQQQMGRTYGAPP